MVFVNLIIYGQDGSYGRDSNPRLCNGLALELVQQIGVGQHPVPAGSSLMSRTTRLLHIDEH